jgi:hypothetical protein
MKMKKIAWFFLFSLGAALIAPCSTGTAFAAESGLFCNTPLLIVNAGRDGSAPRTTIFCVTTNTVQGPPVPPGIHYFAYRNSDDPLFAQFIVQIMHVYNEQILIHSVNQNFVACVFEISTNLSDTSANAWGCGSSNCRIIDYISCQ